MNQKAPPRTRSEGWESPLQLRDQPRFTPRAQPCPALSIPARRDRRKRAHFKNS